MKWKVGKKVRKVATIPVMLSYVAPNKAECVADCWNEVGCWSCAWKEDLTGNRNCRHYGNADEALNEAAEDVIYYEKIYKS